MEINTGFYMFVWYFYPQNYLSNFFNVSLQVSQLRVENSSLLKRLSEINQKFNDAAVDNRVLKADVETMRAKVLTLPFSVSISLQPNPLI